MRAEVQQAVEILQQDQSGGIEQALSLLQDTVYSFSMKVCGHRQDAEDTAQETLLKAIPYLRRFSSPKALGVWLYKVAKSRCLMSRRKSKYAPKENLSLEELMPDRKELEALAGSVADTPEKSFLRGETAEQLRRAVHKLPPQYRLPLVLHDMEELSTGEVARVLGLREGTVRVRLHRARVFVRNELARTTGRTRSRKPRTQPKPRRCRELFAALSDYLDGALDPAMCDKLEKHLDGCQPCEAFLNSLEQTVEQFRRHPPARLHPEVAARIRSALLADYRRALHAVQTAKRSSRRLA
jgi:RNA polymerase sigma-70 factor (ECF subfamily)